MSVPYIPPKQAQYDSWLSNFSGLINTSPATYGLGTSDATTIVAQYTSWHAAYLLATSPATKTPETVQAKNMAHASTLATIRPYAQLIANNAGVTSANKIALGLNPRTNTPQPITAPTTFPNLTIQQAGPLTHVIRYRDSAASPSVKAKPAGAVALQLYGTASATAITDPTVLAFIEPETKTPFQVSWDSSDIGKQVYYAARWITRTGLVGPWSAIVNFTVAGG